MSKRAHIRRRQDSDDDEANQPAEEDSNGPIANEGSDGGYRSVDLLSIAQFDPLFRTTIEDLKLIQKMRQRKNGVTSEELALGKQMAPLHSSRRVDVSKPDFILISTLLLSRVILSKSAQAA